MQFRFHEILLDFQGIVSARVSAVVSLRISRVAEAKSKALYLPNPHPRRLKGGHLSGRSKLSSFEDYWRASKAWQSRGLTLASARALANAGILTEEDLRSANSLELAMIPRIGAKSLALLYELKGEKVPDVPRLCGKAKYLRSILRLGTSGPMATSGGKPAN